MAREFKESLSRSWEEAEKFDRDFWRDAGAFARFAAMYQMVVDHDKLKGGLGDRSRLQRSVEKLQRRGR